MVGRAVEIRQIVEKAQVGGLAVERVGALKLLVAVIIRRARSNVGGRPSRTSCRLIDAMIANICRIDRQLSRKRMLDPKRPVFDIRSPEVAIHRKRIARVGVSEAVSALDLTRYAGGIDGRGLILPGDPHRVAGTGWGERDPGSKNAPDTRTAARALRPVNERGSRGYGTNTERNRILCILLGHESAHGEEAIDDTAASANDSCSLASHIPSHSKAWRKVLVVRVVD